MKRKRIELEVDLIPGDIDAVLESFHVGKDVCVSGLLGTDFLDRYGYIIDFKHHMIFHKFRCVSFKEAMELIGIPYIVLWQEDKKYIFILDTGSTQSHVTNKALETLDYEFDESKSFITVGSGGETQTSGIARAKLYYR